MSDHRGKEDGKSVHDRLLLWAVSMGNTEVAESRLKKGALPDMRNKSAQTLLMIAAARGDTDMCKLLIRYGADPDALSPSGKRVADFAKTEDSRIVIDTASYMIPETGEDEWRAETPPLDIPVQDPSVISAGIALEVRISSISLLDGAEEWDVSSVLTEEDMDA